MRLSDIVTLLAVCLALSACHSLHHLQKETHDSLDLNLLHHSHASSISQVVTYQAGIVNDGHSWQLIPDTSAPAYVHLQRTTYAAADTTSANTVSAGRQETTQKKDREFFHSQISSVNSKISIGLVIVFLVCFAVVVRRRR